MTELSRMEARRADLIRGASIEIFSKGYRNTSVADIANRTGVSHGTFYNYFDSRRTILDAVVDYQFDHLMESVVGPDLLDSASTLLDFELQFTGFHRRLHALLAERPALVDFVMHDAPAIDDGVVDRLLVLFEHVVTMTGSLIANGIAKGFLREAIDVPVAADAMVSLLLASALVADQGERAIGSFVDFAVHAFGVDRP